MPYFNYIITIQNICFDFRLSRITLECYKSASLYSNRLARGHGERYYSLGRLWRSVHTEHVFHGWSVVCRVQWQYSLHNGNSFNSFPVFSRQNVHVVCLPDFVQFGKFSKTFEWRLKERRFRMIWAESTAFLSALWALSTHSTPRKAVDSV